MVKRGLSLQGSRWEKAIAMDRSVLVVTAEPGHLSLQGVGGTKQVKPDSQRKPTRARVLTLGLLFRAGGTAPDGRKAAWVGKGYG